MGTIEFKQVSKKYKENAGYALKDFTLQVKEGELVVIVGSSGSGKSTLLELICGFEALTSGDILIDGQSIQDQLPKDRNVSMVFQNYALLPHLTVYENIAFGMRIRKESKQQIDEKVRWAAALLELEPYLKVKPKKLSGGQRQRVALARAMVRKPKLFLMDEPLSSLDAKLRDNMSTQIKALHEKLHATMLYVTHDQIEAMTMADRLVILDQGKIQQIGSPLEIYHQPKNLFVAQFIGRPSINLFECRRTEFGILLDEAIEPRVNENLLEKNQDYKLGIRSEHIEIDAEKETHLVALLEKVEYLGSETLLHLKYKNCKFVAKNYNDKIFKVGDAIKVHFNLTKAHYFDNQQERVSGGK
ncbi:MAG: ABC transporter ATP-binding protein [Candidatus Cellulosilyticum pullistercoris]|uniref:ABC transporter ATP-binding protein n=1 Tax=Candidatus Cellulosilyticum pullistercoris TaxID=2838521 RepID=A0A9E2KC19_9FIRM|nr:ABC transporter ATP-binding protein [Candidatus Cellulosilyticum pullistercoris]